MLGQNKWNIWTTPPPQPISMIPKWRGFAPFKGGGWDGGLLFLFILSKVVGLPALRVKAGHFPKQRAMIEAK